MKKSTLFTSTVLVLLLAAGMQSRAQECYICPENNNNVTGVAASALGRDNTVNGNSSSAIGNNNTISSGSGFIAGTYSNINHSSGNSVIVGGSNTIIYGSQESYIFGSGSEAQHTRSMLIGHRLKSGASNQIILGAGIVGGFLTCDKMHSLAVGFKSAVPTFFVGETPYDFESGRVGIGNNTDPQAKLHIKADTGEDATLLIEATGTNKTSSLLLGGGPAIIGTTSNSNSLSFVTGNTNTRMFIDGDSGNVGIGTANANVNASLQVVGNMNVGNNPHEGTSIGANAFVGGENSQASGQSAFSYGKSNEAGGPFSVALGREARALMPNSVALGFCAVASGSNTTAIGSFIEASSSSAIVIGSGAGTESDMLRNGFTHSLMMGFNSNVPTLFVSSSIGAGTSGRIGIGNVTDPQAKLHIKADAGENATVLIEAIGNNKTSSLMLGGGPARIGTTSGSNSLSFVTGNTNTRMFIDGDNGNIGIGSDDPVAKLQVKDGDIYIEDINRGIIMKSPDGNCWRGVLNNMGQLEFVLLPDCIPNSISSPDMDQKPGFNIIPNPASGSLQIRCTASDMTKFSTYKLFDSSGKQMKEGALNQTSTRVDIQNLSSGIYILAFFGEGAFWTEKVLIQ